MNRDELLDELAMKLAEWRKGIFIPGGFIWDGMDTITYTETGDVFMRCDWLQRRIELINCPPDSEAPDWAEWKAQDADGCWNWFPCKPKPSEAQWDCERNERVTVAKEGRIPAGHDWRKTLTRINRDDNTSTPEEEAEFERIQARIDSEKPHEADSRMLDAQLADAMGKQPRYLDATGEDWIDEFARTATLDEFRGAMRFTIGKYNRRVGRKDEVLKEVRKMKDYCARWEAYEMALADKESGV